MSIAQAATGTNVGASSRDDVEKIELDCLLEAVFRRYGFDFREYAPASLRRRVNRGSSSKGSRASRRCRTGSSVTRR